MKKFLLFVAAFAACVSVQAQKFDDVSLASVNLNGMPLYFSVPSQAQDALGRAVTVKTYSTVQAGPYDGIYPYAGIDPYGALYGFYPYGGFYGYNDINPYWGVYGGPWGNTVLYTLVMAYPDLVMYFDQNSTGAPQYLANANIYGSQYELNFSSGSVKVGDDLSKLEELFPASCQTAMHRHGGKYPDSFKVIVKAQEGKGMTEESARIVFVVDSQRKIAAIQVKLN